MARIRSNSGGRNSRRQHFHSYSRGVRNHWRPRTGGTNIGARGFRHTHNGRRHGHDFSSGVQRHWGENPGGYSVHHEGYYHSHNSPHRDDDMAYGGQRVMRRCVMPDGSYSGACLPGCTGPVCNKGQGGGSRLWSGGDCHPTSMCNDGSCPPCNDEVMWRRRRDRKQPRPNRRRRRRY